MSGGFSLALALMFCAAINHLGHHTGPVCAHWLHLNMQDQTAVREKCTLLFSQRITNLVLSDYQARFPSKLSLPMIQEPWDFPPRKENTEDWLNFWALWTLPSASPWLARSSEFFNTSVLSHAAALWCSSIKPVRISTSLSIPVFSQLKNSSKGLEAGRKKLLKSNFLERLHPHSSKRKNRHLSSFSSPKESRGDAADDLFMLLLHEGCRETDSPVECTDVAHMDDLFLVQSGKGLLRNVCWTCRFCLQKQNSGELWAQRGGSHLKF